MPPGQRLSNQELKQLLPLCIIRDEAAWETVFNGLYGLLRFIAEKVLRNHSSDDIDDAVAEGFRNVIVAIADVAEARNPLAYIAVVARNAALAQLRRRVFVGGVESHERTPSESDTNYKNGFTAADSLELPTQGLGFMSIQTRDELVRLHSKLSPDERRLLRLKYQADLTYDEIGYIVGKDPGALRVSVHRLVKSLRDALNPDIRDAVLADPRLFSQFAFPELSPASSKDGKHQLDESLLRMLEDYVAEPNSLDASAREQIEVALLSSAEVREQKVILERQLNSIEQDVVGHSADVPRMPAAMLRELMMKVREGATEQ